jgi:hypothetical protein
MMDRQFSPGDVVHVFAIETKKRFRVGMRYSIVIKYDPKFIKNHETKEDDLVDGYEVLVGSKIEWHSVIALSLPCR